MDLDFDLVLTTLAKIAKKNLLPKKKFPKIKVQMHQIGASGEGEDLW